MELTKSSMKIAGVDVGKHRLDVALHRCAAMPAGGRADERASHERASHETAVDNAPDGIATLIAWLRAREVGRVGLEATGGYEKAVRLALEAAGFEVVVHQPIEVRLFARLKRRRAKNDRLDASLIAAATAQVDAIRAAQDPRLCELAERLTAYEQIADELARMKTYLEHVTLADVAAMLHAQIAALKALKASLVVRLLAAIKAAPDLLARYRLLLSLPGVGPIVACALVVRMVWSRLPELGSMRKGQAASLLGVAPFDADSGQHRGLRFIGGGRSRPRGLVYIAALAAKRFDPGFKTFADRLLANGKPKKLVLVAVMRKLIEAANLVLQRGQPWQKRQTA